MYQHMYLKNGAYPSTPEERSEQFMEKLHHQQKCLLCLMVNNFTPLARINRGAWKLSPLCDACGRPQQWISKCTGTSLSAGLIQGPLCFWGPNSIWWVIRFDMEENNFLKRCFCLAFLKYWGPKMVSSILRRKKREKSPWVESDACGLCLLVQQDRTRGDRNTRYKNWDPSQPSNIGLWVLCNSVETVRTKGMVVWLLVGGLKGFHSSSRYLTSFPFLKNILQGWGWWIRIMFSFWESFL